MAGKKRILYFGFIFLMVLCGCGRKEVDYEDITASSTDESGGASAVNAQQALRFSEQLGAPERWEERILGESTTTNVEADVYVPDINGAKSVRVALRKSTPEYRKTVVEKLAEGAVYRCDEESMPKTYWQKQIEDANRYYEEAVKSGWDTAYAEVWLSQVQEMYEKASTDFVVAEDYSGMAYLITSHGNMYELRFTERDGYVSSVDMVPFDVQGKISWLSPADGSENFSDIFPNAHSLDMTMIDVYTYGTEENIYKGDYEDALAQAESFLAGLGISGFEPVRNYDYCIGLYNVDNHNAATYYNGCEIVFYRDIDGMFLADAEIEKGKNGQIYELDNGTTVEYFQERRTMESLYVAVNDAGVVGFRYEWPLEIRETLTENVSLLSYEKIHDIFTERIKQQESSRNAFYGSYPKYDELRLIYYICSEDAESEEGMLVPAWRLSGSYLEADGTRDAEFVLMINAVDGSLIKTEADW